MRHNDRYLLVFGDNPNHFYLLIQEYINAALSRLHYLGVTEGKENTYFTILLTIDYHGDNLHRNSTGNLISRLHYLGVTEDKLHRISTD